MLTDVYFQERSSYTCKKGLHYSMNFQITPLEYTSVIVLIDDHILCWVGSTTIALNLKKGIPGVPGVPIKAPN